MTDPVTDPVTPEPKTPESVLIQQTQRPLYQKQIHLL